MGHKRKWKYGSQQVAKVMHFKHPASGPISKRERRIFAAQEGALGLVDEFADSGQPGRFHKITDTRGRVRVWIEADKSSVTCFAIEVSEDGGRTFINPLAP